MVKLVIHENVSNLIVLMHRKKVPNKLVKLAIHEFWYSHDFTYDGRLWVTPLKVGGCGLPHLCWEVVGYLIYAGRLWVTPLMLGGYGLSHLWWEVVGYLTYVGRLWVTPLILGGCGLPHVCWEVVDYLTIKIFFFYINYLETIFFSLTI